MSKESGSQTADSAHGHSHMEGDPHGALGRELPKIAYDLPDGWQSQPASKMRAANFTIDGPEEQQAEVAVIPLPGMSAGDAEVVNLWRDQLGLARWTPDQVAAEAAEVKVGDTAGKLFDLVSEKALIEEKHKARTLVAMLTRDDTAWFFKMTGHESLVATQKMAFLKFLESIRYEASAGPTASSTPATPSSPAPVGSGTADSGRPTWTLPQGWTSSAPPPMALAGFATEGGATVSVTMLEGNGGGLLANVNRWRGQIGLSPVDEKELAATSESFESSGDKILLVDLKGTNVRTGKPSRLLGAIVMKATKSWFYKLQGDDEVVGREKARFVEFVKSIRYPHG